MQEVKNRASHYIELEERHGAHNYHPLPVVLSRGRGVYVWDVEGKRYYDFLSAYSAVNQGHCHPRLVKALSEQAERLALTSRAFYNDRLGPYEAFLTRFFGYDKLLPMNTGAEAVETAIKICRKWGYEKKQIPEDEALIIVCGQNFHGRTVTIISFSSDPDAKGHFGPYTPGFLSIPYGDLAAFRQMLEERAEQIAGFLVEPIQGEAGVVVPPENFLRETAELCRQHNVLFIADEIQTGIGRTGSLLAVCGNCTCEGSCERGPTYTKPDILLLGKALSGGMYPVSAVLADDSVMEVITPGTHGSTYGGNPLACAVAVEALQIVEDEGLPQNARKLGKIFREHMQKLVDQYPQWLKGVRGKGLLNALLINDKPDSKTAWNLCLQLANNGLLAKPTHGNIIRFAPPLTISEEQLLDCCRIIEKTISSFSQK